MFSLLLFIIYLSFISLGLPDAVLGAAWPIIHEEFGVPISFSGSIYMLISCCTILSSLKSESLRLRFGTGKITAFSVLLTAVAIFGFSISPSLSVMLFFAIPYGLGAGSVDAALNHYVAVHYSGRSMNWLHCMWGIGAALGPYILGFVLQRGESWRSGYLVLSMIQATLTIVLFLSLGLWGKEEKKEKTEEKKTPMSFRQILSITGAKECLVSFFLYCAIEQTLGLWSGSFMVYSLKIEAKLAASFVALFYFGITFGRFLAGILAAQWQDEALILGGCGILFLGLVLLFCSMVPSQEVKLFGMELRQILVICALLLSGLGCAPIYPAIIHSTPRNFGAENTSALIGKQMAAAYIGSMSFPPFFGVLAKIFGTGLFPFFSTVLFFGMLFMYRNLLYKTRGKRGKIER
ncbi:MFS transporter [Oribacterium sp. oral taxon 108]|uniref:MFS transporter n=1 Tax=Oribacterium sp. oral taxon 108 TaxID=712414 RepID=UPI00020DD1C6|nr:MFS transporter [Oribacterium sp. oral taxon 108]EGL36753.1 transporter, major facilitator family protein [Oribacterium sp. oral taxon 108 str. F0425]